MSAWIGRDCPPPSGIYWPGGEVRRCGEQGGVFYDRDGNYFRPGVDPRRSYGRLVPQPAPESEPEPTIWFWTKHGMKECTDPVCDNDDQHYRLVAA